MDRITSLPENHIFVFGSNEAGIHGAGAALDAKKYFGAVTGMGVGLHGQSYAIPTKSERIQTLSLTTINLYIHGFNMATHYYPEYIFHVTPIGTGLAGYTIDEIATLFAKYEWGNNTVWPLEFLNHWDNIEYDYRPKKLSIIKRLLSKIL